MISLKHKSLVEHDWSSSESCCKICLYLVPPPVMAQSCLLTFVHSPVPVCSSIFLYVLFHVFDALLLFALHIKRCPVFVNTFNHSHKFVQLSLVLHPATSTNNQDFRALKGGRRWCLTKVCQEECVPKDLKIGFDFLFQSSTTPPREKKIKN
jgi:hypothetical protein